MFYHLNGIVSDIDLNLAVIDCNGVGYAVNTTTNTLSRLKLNDLEINTVVEPNEENHRAYAAVKERFEVCYKALLPVYEYMSQK